jgi:hypothetical protein
MAAASRILTAKEVADYLRCHISTVYRLAKSGKLPGFRLQNWLNVELNSSNSAELAELGIQAPPDSRNRIP